MAEKIQKRRNGNHRVTDLHLGIDCAENPFNANDQADADGVWLEVLFDERYTQGSALTTRLGVLDEWQLWKEIAERDVLSPVSGDDNDGLGHLEVWPFFPKRVPIDSAAKHMTPIPSRFQAGIKADE